MKKLFIFLFGLSLSAFVGYKVGYGVSKKHYEHLADAEISSIKKAFEKRHDQLPPVNKKQKERLTQKPTNEDKNKVDKNKPLDYNSLYGSGVNQRIAGYPAENDTVHIKEEEVDTTKPYIITPEEFQDSEYETVTLYYCDDKVLTDDAYIQINNVGIVGGYHILDQMGKYDSDCLYVCDEKKGVVYEILKEERTYDQVRHFGAVEE